MAQAARYQQLAAASVLSYILMHLVSCAQQPDQLEALRIGVIATISGDQAGAGEETLRGAALAVARQNLQGGIEVDGERYRVELVVGDSQGSSEEALRQALSIINHERVIALVGPVLSRTALTVGDLADKTRIPMISPSATHPDVTRAREYVFRVTFDDDYQGRMLARFAAEDLEAGTAAVLYDVADAYNRRIAGVFKQSFEAAGGVVVAFEEYITGDETFGEQLASIRESQPDVLFLPNYPKDVPSQVRHAREAGITAVLLGNDSWTVAEVDAVEFEGAFHSQHWHPGLANAQSQDFIEAYRQTHKKEPSVRAALSYDAVGLLLQAIRHRQSLDGRVIRDGLAQLDQYRGVTGAITYRGSGDPIRELVMVKVVNGRRELQEGGE